MDSLLWLGPKDHVLQRLLSRIGCELVAGQADSPLQDVMSQHLFDLIVLDARAEDAPMDLIEYFQTDVLTKQLPIMVLAASAEQRSNAEQRGLTQIKFVDVPFSHGSLVGKIATELRLRKMKGAQSTSASLAEVNASLRDLNERMRKEREEARTIQQSLLPDTLPQDKRFELAVSYDPLEEVGGDWYFVTQEQNKSLSLLMADVTGHGLAAAFIGSMTKLALSAAKQFEPAALLGTMNELMTPQLPEGRFVTCLSANYDPHSGILKTSFAGHPPCLHFSQQAHSVTKIGANGFPFGFTADGTYEVLHAQLGIGDTVVFLTDGILEAQNRAKDMYGFDRLSQILITNPEAKPAQLVATILHDLEKFCDGRLLKDDVTLMILKRSS